VTALLWFTRDLRVHDHPALNAALAGHEHVIPVFCLDDRLLHGRHASGPRTQFMLEALTDLDGALRDRGSALVVRHGPPERELPVLAAELAAGAVHCSADTTPFARARADWLRPALHRAGVSLRAHPGLHVIDDVSDPAGNGRGPFTVFSPFHRAWLRATRRAVLPAPDRLPPLPSRVQTGTVPSLDGLGLTSPVEASLRGGESRARTRADRFLTERVTGYNDSRDAPAASGTSQLSPYLHFGCITARELEQRLPGGDGAESYRGQLCWRDFHHHVLLHHPGNARRALQRRFRDLNWSNDRSRFQAWCDGRTGYPFVDAGMRQLRQEGWMHNRVRLVAGSFLTKDLAIDWRWGERWFMRLLIDADETTPGTSSRRRSACNGPRAAPAAVASQRRRAQCSYEGIAASSRARGARRSPA
jgi:deoxyribodipyrimidine photo-lyase